MCIILVKTTSSLGKPGLQGPSLTFWCLSKFDTFLPVSYMLISQMDVHNGNHSLFAPKCGKGSIEGKHPPSRLNLRGKDMSNHIFRFAFLVSSARRRQQAGQWSKSSAEILKVLRCKMWQCPTSVECRDRNQIRPKGFSQNRNH